MPTFNIYVPSYNRYNAINTQNHVEYCTYVVRKSQEQNYIDAGIKNVWAIEDEKINSLPKVMNYILDNAKEDVICMIDDDLYKLQYRISEISTIDDKEIATSELERIAQIMYDLDIGYGGSPIDSNIKFYDRSFKFSGITSGIKFFNLSKIRNNRFREDFKFLNDIDFILHELLRNRVVLIPNYLINEFGLDTNEGGNNGQKTLSEFYAEEENMVLKWGRYYKQSNGRSKGRLNVKR